MSKENLSLTWTKLANDYDTLIPILDERIRNPEKTLLRKPAPASDAAKFRRCIVDFKRPLIKALQIRAGVSSGDDSAGTVASAIENSASMTPKRRAARDLLEYLRVGLPRLPEGVEEPKERKPTESSLEPRMQYVFYMTETLTRLKEPASPCLPFTRMANLINDTMSSQGDKATGLTLTNLIERGNEVLKGNPKELDPRKVNVEGEKLAAEAFAEAHPEGGRKTRRRKRSSAGRKRVKMSRRK